MMAPRAGQQFSFLLTAIVVACNSHAVPAAKITPSYTTGVTLVSPVLGVTPSVIPSLSPAPTLFVLPWSVVAIVPCAERRSSNDDLFAIVTAAFGLASDYVPPGLVKLENYLPGKVTLPDMLLRREAAEALGKLVKDILARGFAPTVLSAYRSFFDQAVARNRWDVEDPANAFQVSAVPGHSEHQLGTAEDFGSPGFADLTGDPAVKFSPMFEQTAEGNWLANYAHLYGFTMTNPPDAQPWTGLVFEPWHYQYVGVDLATWLFESGNFLDGYLFKVRTGLPCVP